MPDRFASPPRRTAELLQEWVDDYIQGGLGSRVDVRVAPQDPEGMLDSGLVILADVATGLEVFMQPRGFDDPMWELTVPAREEDMTMTPQDLASVAAATLEASRLCSYLQFRSLEWDRSSGTRG